jgi:hypothetical protein
MNYDDREREREISLTVEIFNWEKEGYAELRTGEAGGGRVC